MEIESAIKTMRSKVHSSFIVDSLEYIYKSGRCSTMQNIVGSLLKIRPVIEVLPDGTLGIKEKIRGSPKKGLDFMLEDFRSHLPELDSSRVFVTHSGCEEDTIFLRDSILQMVTPQEIYITLAGATIGSHCGPNTIGILYMTK